MNNNNKPMKNIYWTSFVIKCCLIVMVIINDSRGCYANPTADLRANDQQLKQQQQQQQQQNCEIVHEGYLTAKQTSNYGNYKKFALAVDNEYCGSIGKEIIHKKNGSVVDAAIAVVLCNGVVNSHSSGIGGGMFMMIYLKEKNQMFAIDARERAPFSSDTFMYLNASTPPLSSVNGGSAVGIPGELLGLYEAHKLAGRLAWRELFQPAIKLCNEGYYLTLAMENALNQTEKRIRSNPEFARIFINPLTNKLFRKGDLIRRPKLARTLDIISRKGVKAFYNGSLTNSIVSEINENGGQVRSRDFSEYRAHVKEPIMVQLDKHYRAFVVPPPSGGLVTAFALKLMSVGKFLSSNTSTLFYHHMIESFKHAYAYRAQLGDEDYVANIDQLIELMAKNETFVREIRSRIDDSQTFPASYYGNLTFQSDHGTSHTSILGENGDAVSITTSVNTYFGSFLMGKQTGIIYNNQMDDFSTPGLANYYRIRPSQSNKIQPGKRPQSSMSPMIVLHNDENNNNNVRLIIGASGGSKIISSVAQVALKNLYLNRSLNDAVDDKRVHEQLYPEYVELEEGFPLLIQQSLYKFGHSTQCFSFGGSIIQAISKIGANIMAVSDARKGGVPDGE